MKRLSAKEAIHLFFNHQLSGFGDNVAQLGARIQYTAKGADGAMWHSLELAHMVSPLNDLPPLPKAWAMYAYAGKGHYTTVEHMLLLRHTIKACNRAHLTKGEKADERVEVLAAITLADSAYRESCGKSPFTVEWICDQLGTNPKNYARDWGRKAATMHALHNRWSAQALGPVAAQIDKIFEANREIG